VLGDDLVIADARVAETYLDLLKDLGMEVNLHKSILSPGGTCLEFAKRTIFVYPETGIWVDISPVPLKEISSASDLLPGVVQFGVKYALSLPRLLQAFRFGWRNISQINRPLGKLSAQIRTIVLAIAIPHNPDQQIEFFNLGTPKLKKFVADLVQIGIDFKLTTLKAAVPGIARKLEACLSVLTDKPSLLDSMVKDFLPFIAEKTIPGSQESAFADEITAWVLDHIMKPSFTDDLRGFFELL